ncbi:UNVERIFIED_CONTAM: hypothetical protein FKN15_003603 [Acipenser sinensis]
MERKRKGGTEKIKDKQQRSLEADAAKCTKITDMFRRPAGSRESEGRQDARVNHRLSLGSPLKKMTLWQGRAQQLRQIWWGLFLLIAPQDTLLARPCLHWGFQRVTLAPELLRVGEAKLAGLLLSVKQHGPYWPGAGLACPSEACKEAAGLVVVAEDARRPSAPLSCSGNCCLEEHNF